jgi:hypothetical protein
MSSKSKNPLSLSELQARANDIQAVLFDIRSFKNLLSGKEKMAFKNTQFDEKAHMLISTRQSLAIVWELDALTVEVNVSLLQSSSEINARRAQVVA